jgi:hypothetical protein
MSTLDVATESLKGLAGPLKDDEDAKALWHVIGLFDGFSRAVEQDDHAAAGQLSPEFGLMRQALKKQ